jgi:hypothetical protein
MMRKLDQDKVTTYAKIAQKITDLTKKKEKMRGKIIAKMEAGYICPTGGPYIIELYYQETQVPSWKEEWQRLARKQYGSGWREAMRRLIVNTPVNNIPKLKAKINSRYRVVRDSDEKVVEFRKRGAA